MDNIRDDEWINSRQAFQHRPNKRPVEVKLDKTASEIAGRPITVNDPKLIHKIAEWTRKRNPNDNNASNFLADPQKREELKRFLNNS